MYDTSNLSLRQTATPKQLPCGRVVGTLIENGTSGKHQKVFITRRNGQLHFYDAQPLSYEDALSLHAMYAMNFLCLHTGVDENGQHCTWQIMYLIPSQHQNHGSWFGDIEGSVGV